MMSPEVRAEYKRFRSLGWPASDALSGAQVAVRFAEVAFRGEVRIREVPEDEPYDVSYIDTWGLSPGRAEREKKRIFDLIERDGVWCYVAEVLQEDGSWEVVDSIGFCVGDDLTAGGYLVELMRSALNAHCREMKRREEEADRQEEECWWRLP